MKLSNIHSLIYKNKISEINKILDKKTIRNRDYNFELPIHIACRLGNEKIIDLFYKKDPSLFLERNNYGEMSFHLLIYYPKLLIKYLSKFDIKKFKKFKDIDKYGLNILNSKTQTPLLKYILETDDLDKNILKLFDEKGLDINFPKYNSRFKKIILQKNAFAKFSLILDVFKKININLYDKHNNPPLYYAIQQNNIELIKAHKSSPVFCRSNF